MRFDFLAEGGGEGRWNEHEERLEEVKKRVNTRIFGVNQTNSLSFLSFSLSLSLFPSFLSISPSSLLANFSLSFLSPFLLALFLSRSFLLFFSLFFLSLSFLLFLPLSPPQSTVLALLF